MPFNLGIGGAMQSGYIYALEHGYEVAVQVDGDGQHDPRHIHELLARLRADPELNMVTGSRFLDPDRRRLPLLGHPAHGHPHLRQGGLADHPPARHRPDLRLSHDQPARHRAVRARLPARLPRGRGDPADARPPPAQLRDPGADAPAPDGRVGDLLDPVGLLHGQGAAGGVRRPVPPRARRSQAEEPLEPSPSEQAP